LEEAAQALYRKMFVDDVDVENLPDGWRMGCLGEVIENTIGGDWGKEIQEGNFTQLVSCIRGADINNAKLANFKETPQRYILEKNLSSRQLSEGDIIIEISGGTPTQSTGRSVLVSGTLLKNSNHPLICSNFCRVIKPRKCHSEYLYSSLTYLYNLNVFFRYENSSNGIQNLDLDAVMKEEILLIPSISALNKFSIRYNSFTDEQIMLGIENQLLTEMRTMLMAGIA
jgi:type I restriction enzyme S subunit